MSGASLPTQPDLQFVAKDRVLIPDEWGKSSDVKACIAELLWFSLNPR